MLTTTNDVRSTTNTGLANRSGPVLFQHKQHVHFSKQNNPSGETREGTKMKPPSSSWNRPTTTSANLLPTMIPTTALLTEPATPPLAPPPGKRGKEGGELKRSAPASPPRARAPASPARITRRPTANPRTRGWFTSPARARPPLVRGRQLIEPPAGYRREEEVARKRGRDGGALHTRRGEETAGHSDFVFRLRCFLRDSRNQVPIIDGRRATAEIKSSFTQREANGGMRGEREGRRGRKH